MSFTIRAMSPDDLATTVLLRNQPAVRRGTMSTPYESVDRMRKYLAEQAATGAPPETQLVACHGDLVVGQAALHRSSAARCAHVASIGIHVHEDWHGKGVGTALFAALLELADNWLNLRRLELMVFTENAPALALYKKFGFASEGLLRMDAFTDGAFTDAYFMARLRGELAPDLSAAPPPASPAPPGPFTLRAAEPEDLAGVAAFMDQPRVRHGTLRLPFAPAEVNRFIVEPTDRAIKTILAVAGGVPVGVTRMVPGKGRRSHVADLTLLAVHDAWAGRGIGKALLAAALNVADNWLNLRRVTLHVMADNAAAIAVYQAAGFAVEAHKRADTFRNGAYADSFAMARLR
jgi:putative acetyltransferase